MRGGEVVDLASIRGRQKGIGSNDPQTDPYYQPVREYNVKDLYLD